MGTRKRNVNSQAKAPGRNASRVTPNRDHVKKASSVSTTFIIISACLLISSVVVFYTVDVAALFDKFTSSGIFSSQKPVTLQDSSQQPDSQPKLSKEEVMKKISKSPTETYEHSNMTNTDDFEIRAELDLADSVREKGQLSQAMVHYAVILAKHPHSPRAIYGKARTLEGLAEMERSNDRLKETVDEYLKILKLPNVPKILMVDAGRRCAERQTFRGWGQQAVNTMKRLLDLYPGDIKLMNELGVKYLMIAKSNEARVVFRQVLEHEPENGFALAHMGFIIKTVDHDYEAAIPYLLDGVQSGEEGVIDGRFFFHLGDAMHRTNRPQQAMEIYQLGADNGLFRSKWQRSLYNVDSLTARPWWTLEQTGHAAFLKKLEENWEVIRDEGLANMDEKTGSFVKEEEDLREKGDWRQFTLFSRGQKSEKNCKKAPKTCALIEKYPDVAKCKRGQVKFSVMLPGVHVWPHCGPTNCRLRSHLGLVVPDDRIRIRVVEETRTWTEGKVFVFDDSFEHEVWHDSDKFRLVLIADMWHPELTGRQKTSLSPI